MPQHPRRHDPVQIDADRDGHLLANDGTHALEQPPLRVRLLARRHRAVHREVNAVDPTGRCLGGGGAEPTEQLLRHQEEGLVFQHAR